MALLCTQGAAAQHAIELSAAEGTSRIVAPGKVFTQVIALRNVSRNAVTVTLGGSFPSGWSPIVALPTLSIGPGQTASRLVAFQVSPAVPAGPADISFRAFSDDRVVSNELMVDAEIAARRSVVVRELERPEAIRAGLPVRHTYMITNTGNAPVNAVINAGSSAGYPISIDPPALRLERGETGLAEVFVHSRNDLANTVTHRLVVDVKALDPADNPRAFDDASRRTPESSTVRISTPVEILPIHASTRRETAVGLPVDLTFGASAEEGRAAGQVEAEIRPTTLGDLQIEAIIRTPDVRRASSFGRQDRYAAVVSAHRSELRVGDHVWRSTDLLEIGQYGFGAGAETHSGRWSAGGHAMRSRYLFPVREQYAAYGTFRVDPRLDIGLHSIARRRYEAGVAGSALATARPFPTVQIEGELAAGYAGDATDQQIVGGTQDGGPDFGWAVRGTGSHGRSSWSAAYRGAGANFPGSIRDTRTATAAANFYPTEALRVQLQGRRQHRFFDSVDESRVRQTTSFRKVGAGPVLRFGKTGLTAMIHATARSQSNGLFGLARRERSLEAEAIAIHSRTSIRASLRRGATDTRELETELDGGEPASFMAADVAAARGLGAWSASVGASITDGPTFFNPVDQRRISGSVAVVRQGQITRASATIYRSMDVLADNRSFTTADVRFSRKFLHGVDVGMRARHVSASSTRSIRDATIGIEVGIPLDLPMPTSIGPTVLKGRLVDVETGTGIEGVGLRLGSDATETDDMGRFSLKMPTHLAYLNIDRPSIGLDRMPVAAFPMPIDPALHTGPATNQSTRSTGERASGPEVGLDIRVVRSAAIDIQVLFPAPVSDPNAPAATPMSAAEKAGILVEARLRNAMQGISAEDASRSSRLRRRMLGRTTNLEFADLLPGDWVVRVVSETLPTGWRTRPDSVVVTLAPGASASSVIDIVPERRTIRMISTGRVRRVPIVVEAHDSAEAVARTDSTAAIAPTDSTATIAPTPDGVTYVVRRDDMLSFIASRHYQGRSWLWPRIWLANRNVLPAPHALKPGMVLSIPSGTPRLTDEEWDILQNGTGASHP